jgi:hypothetical protein
MRIRRPRNISTKQLFLVTILGVFSGIYIYQPYFLKNLKAKEAVKPSSSEEKAVTPQK